MGLGLHVSDVTSPGAGREGANGDAVGVVLAGGDSTRFAGGDKALATVDGEPIVARVVAILRRATGREPIVAVRTDGQRSTYRRVLPPDVAFVEDAPGFSGPLAGVLAAAAVASRPWLFVTGCDMPLLSAEAVRWTIERADDADAVAIRNADGTLEPLHACYRRSAVLSARERLPEAAGLRDLLDALGSTLALPAADAPPDVPVAASLSNVNTRGDLEGLPDRRTDVE